jgi:hypothetical protein
MEIFIHSSMPVLLSLLKFWNRLIVEQANRSSYTRLMAKKKHPEKSECSFYSKQLFYKRASDLSIMPKHDGCKHHFSIN